jgi:hypothetical protein
VATVDIGCARPANTPAEIQISDSMLSQSSDDARLLKFDYEGSRSNFGILGKPPPRH